ncbi:MAG: TIGR04282 family arsenosugar biosynthesis glycosyltransferase [Bacteroidota bacterium]
MGGKKGLLIFAKFPDVGNVKTRLGRTIGMQKAASVYQELAGHTFAIGADVARRGVTVYIFFEATVPEEVVRNWVRRPFSYAPQVGTTLGERMRNAFDLTFARGMDEAVIVGTDIPGLSSPLIDAAFEFLRSKDVVIGPAADGGYYLLGMKAPTKDLFSGIVWSTPAVLPSTIDRIDQAGLRYALLEQLADIDTEESYREYLRTKTG